jgi:putative Mg2+ transporter-C (MgtC) family protein
VRVVARTSPMRLPPAPGRSLALSSAPGAAHALNGEGWLQAGELGLALLLSAAIGLEREVRQKNAGLRTAGLIFVRRDSVRGLTTAAAIWVTAAIGSASGAGLPLLAVLTTVIYFLIAVVFPVVTRRLIKSGGRAL